MDFPEPDRLPADARGTVTRLLAGFDRALPGRVCGLYLVGSIALDAYRPGRSDIDFVAVIEPGPAHDGDHWAFSPEEVRALHRAQLAMGVRVGASALWRGHLMLPGHPNGVFVRRSDLRRPVTSIRPLGSQISQRFRVGSAFDVNPVQWTTFARNGVAVRGPAPASLGLDPQPDLLRQWNLDNLAGYWVPWAESTLRRRNLRWRLAPGWHTAWGVLGAPRLLHTIDTGDVISKEAAGEWAKNVLDPRHHDILDTGLAWWRGEPPSGGPVAPAPVRARATAELVLAVGGAASSR